MSVVDVTLLRHKRIDKHQKKQPSYATFLRFSPKTHQKWRIQVRILPPLFLLLLLLPAKNYRTKTVGEIPDVIHGLVTSSSVTTQRTTLEYYFLPDARFDHPLCRVDSFAYPLFSRSFIMGTYRWYKLLSPVIELDVESIAFDEPHGRLYVSATQIFTYWFFPFIRIPTTLVVVLELQKMQRRRATRVQDESSSEHSSDGPQQPDGGSGDESGGEDERWYIKSQTDLYQFEQWIGFIPFVGLLARYVWMLQ